MAESETFQRLYGSENDGVFYVPGHIMKTARIKPGDKLKITPENNGLKIAKVEDPRPGGPTD